MRKLRQPPAILHATVTLDGKLAGDTAPRLVRKEGEETLDGIACREHLLNGTITEIHLTVRAQIDGRAGADTPSGQPTPEFFPRSVALRLTQLDARDSEAVLRYKVVARP